MLTADLIREKLLRQYPDVLTAWLTSDNFFPIRIPVGRLPEDFATVREYIQELKTGAKRYGYRIEFERRRSKRWGEQDFPTAVYIDTLEILLAFLGKQQEAQNFQNDAALILSVQPLLESWMVRYPLKIIEYAGKWADLLQVCQFFIDNPQHDLFMRELPINAHTKFIEGHKSILRSLLDHLQPQSIDETQSDFARRYGLRTDEPLVRIRLLDNQLEKRHELGIHDLTIPVSQLQSLDLSTELGIIVENKTSFLTLPSFPGAFAIFGSGFDVSILKVVTWLKHTRLLYWGDLDAQGFEILALLRRSLPNVQSVMMNQETLEKFRKFAVSGTPAIPTHYPELRDDEAAVYQLLADHNLRLEQERIDPQYVSLQLYSLLK
jgi:hypothetical protein